MYEFKRTPTARDFEDLSGWSVYVICCKPYHGKLIAKIGSSSAVYRRAMVIAQAIPFEIDTILHVYAGSKDCALTIERAMLAALASKRLRSEWLELDLATDKELFNSKLRDAYRMFTHQKDLVWQRISRAELRRFASEYYRTKRITKSVPILDAVQS